MANCSVIVPAFNCARFIGDCLDSILKQTYTDFEVIVTDDGSTDQTVDIVGHFESKDRRIALLRSGKQTGAAATRNRAIAHAAGRYIAFLDSDDIWYEDKLALQIHQLSQSAATISFAPYDLIDRNGVRIGSRHNLPQTVRFSNLLLYNPIGCLTAVVDREKSGDFRFVDIEMRNDWATWLELLRPRGRTAESISKPVAALRIRNDSLTSNKYRATKLSYTMLRSVADVSPLRAAIGAVSHGARSLLATKRKPGGQE